MKEDCCEWSGTVLAPGASFERSLLLTVWDRFGCGSQPSRSLLLLSGSVLAPGLSFLSSLLFTVREPYFDSGSQFYFRVLLFTIRNSGTGLCLLLDVQNRFVRVLFRGSGTLLFEGFVLLVP